MSSIDQQLQFDFERYADLGEHTVSFLSTRAEAEATAVLFMGPLALMAEYGDAHVDTSLAETPIGTPEQSLNNELIHAPKKLHLAQAAIMFAQKSDFDLVA